MPINPAANSVRMDRSGEGVKPTPASSAGIEPRKALQTVMAGWILIWNALQVHRPKGLPDRRDSEEADQATTHRLTAYLIQGRTRAVPAVHRRGAIMLDAPPASSGEQLCGDPASLPYGPVIRIPAPLPQGARPKPTTESG